MWKSLAPSRSQHFGGAQDGVNKNLTTAWLQKLTNEADEMQYLQEQGLLGFSSCPARPSCQAATPEALSPEAYTPGLGFRVSEFDPE